jgi:Holliday junction resolvase RusA-like endonuclease
LASLSFFAAGIPVQQGSKVPGRKKNGALFVRESAKGLKAWRKTVKEAAEAACLASDEWDSGYDGPISLGPVLFVFPTIQAKRHWKTSAPDLDKLLRAIGDAMTDAKVYVDDSRIVCYDSVQKIHGTEPGVLITVKTIGVDS